MTDDVMIHPASDGDLALLALTVVDQVPAMMAYWDRDEVCQFANEAYLAWFGKTRGDLLGTRLSELLGSLYPLNLPYIQGALAGEVQVFERQIPSPDGGRVRDSIATYTPDIRDGEVLGFFVHVADTTMLKDRERELDRVVRERERALAEIRTLRGLMSVCAGCKQIRDEHGNWVPMEDFLAQRTGVVFSHGLCTSCVATLYPGL
jgi:PAS domain S-box-containing protein